jgi:hypothetical protein
VKEAKSGDKLFILDKRNKGVSQHIFSLQGFE